ncbi:outer membrane-specific lipoprotein transporter subunit LolE [Anaerohalosphaera lusitana]|uniref:Outer membrane-specific lipoprotein transporter subunit LolE n=1 Tax=Anaerohalosphaera lusitana TaxID=1936003 RepID=A0A1U9NRC1_9BACT|nr:FtsX-like permease family protein [Anaerohalosphaera lusitana]AQT70268.1 outer membrane-specific lipoprotein transporter subunit LolE [Anaerohalosphaera lusitana]
MKHLSVVLCRRYLSKKKIVLLSVASVAMSCALLVVVASLFTGFIASFESTVSDHVGDVVISGRRGVLIEQYDRLIAELDELDEVESSTAVLSGKGGLLFLGPGNVRAVQLYGIEMPRRSKVTPFGDMLVRQKGSDSASFTPEWVKGGTGGFLGIGVISSPDEKTDEYDMAEVQDFIGRKVVLTTGDGQSTKTQLVKFTVADVVFSGFHWADKDFVYLPMERVLDEFYPDSGKVADMVQIKVAEGYDPAATVAQVRSVWERFADQELGWSLPRIAAVQVQTARQNWARLISEYQKQLGMLMVIFGVVSGGVVLLIACIFYMIVITKRRDIAVVKSCGMGGFSVAGLFLFFGSIVGVVGSGIGIAAGYVITKNINSIEAAISSTFGLKLWQSSTYMFSTIPDDMNWSAAGWVVIASVIASMIGAIIPAIRAATLRPVKILRYE